MPSFSSRVATICSKETAKSEGSGRGNKFESRSATNIVLINRCQDASSQLHDEDYHKGKDVESEETLAFPDGATAAQESHDEDEGTNGNQNVAGNLKALVSLYYLSQLDDLVGILVQTQPETNTQDTSSWQLWKQNQVHPDETIMLSTVKEGAQWQCIILKVSKFTHRSCVYKKRQQQMGVSK